MNGVRQITFRQVLSHGIDCLTKEDSPLSHMFFQQRLYLLVSGFDADEISKRLKLRCIEMKELPLKLGFNEFGSNVTSLYKTSIDELDDYVNLVKTISPLCDITGLYLLMIK